MKNKIYRLHSAFARAINYINENSAIVSLVLPEIGGGRGNLIMERLPQTPPDEIWCDEFNFGWDDLIYPRANYDDSLSVPPPSPKDAENKIAALLPLFPENGLAFLFKQTFEPKAGFAAAMAQKFKAGAEKLRNGEYESGAKELRGLGYGLTPAGDDFLCGYLSALYLRKESEEIRKAIYLTAKGNNLIANHFLTAAFKCSFFARFKAFAQSFCIGTTEEPSPHFFPCLKSAKPPAQTPPQV